VGAFKTCFFVPCLHFFVTVISIPQIHYKVPLQLYGEHSFLSLHSYQPSAFILTSDLSNDFIDWRPQKHAWQVQYLPATHILWKKYAGNSGWKSFWSVTSVTYFQPIWYVFLFSKFSSLCLTSNVMKTLEDKGTGTSWPSRSFVSGVQHCGDLLHGQYIICWLQQISIVPSTNFITKGTEAVTDRAGLLQNPLGIILFRGLQQPTANAEFTETQSLVACKPES
jgi:hypothetical protein